MWHNSSQTNIYIETKGGVRERQKSGLEGRYTVIKDNKPGREREKIKRDTDLIDKFKDIYTQQERQTERHRNTHTKTGSE